MRKIPKVRLALVVGVLLELLLLTAGGFGLRIGGEPRWDLSGLRDAGIRQRAKAETRSSTRSVSEARFPIAP
jgi:hypothetical protein